MRGTGEESSGKKSDDEHFKRYKRRIITWLVFEGGHEFAKRLTEAREKRSQAIPSTPRLLINDQFL